MVDLNCFMCKQFLTHVVLLHCNTIRGFPRLLIMIFIAALLGDVTGRTRLQLDPRHSSRS